MELKIEPNPKIIFLQYALTPKKVIVSIKVMKSKTKLKRNLHPVPYGKASLVAVTAGRKRKL